MHTVTCNKTRMSDICDPFLSLHKISIIAQYCQKKTDFATEIKPSNVFVVNPGETQTAYVYVAAKKSAPVGENIFSITVKSNDEVLQQIPLKVNVVQNSKYGTLKKVLEAGLIVLIVLLVILGLIIGFSKLRSDEEDSEDSETQTYY